MRYVLTCEMDAVFGQDYREPLSGATVRLYRPAGNRPAAFRLLGPAEAKARADRLLIDAVTDAQGKAELDLDTGTAVYDGGPLEVGLRAPLRYLFGRRDEFLGRRWSDGSSESGERG